MKGVGTKAIAGAGSIPLAAQLVEIVLYFTALAPPQNIVSALTAVVSAGMAYAAIYFTPRETGA